MANTPPAAPPVAKAKTPTPSAMNFTARGSTGLVQQDGRVDQEINAKLRGGRGQLMFREMADNDSTVGSLIYLVKTFLRQPEWVTHPAMDNDPEAADWAQFVDSCLTDMSHTWRDFISEIVSMAVYGWAYFEVVYKRRAGPATSPKSKYDDGYIGIRQIAIRPQGTLERWELDQDGGIQGMWQRPPPTTVGGVGMGDSVLLPIEFGLLFRTETTANNPEGRSLLRNAVRSYLFLKRMQEIEAVGTERDLSGYPVMEVPLRLFDETPIMDPDGNALPNENTSMLAQLQTQLSEIRRDAREGAIIPAEDNEDGTKTGFRFRLMSGGGTRALNLDVIIRRYESRMAMCLLGEFILLGTDKVGSYSMHASKTDVFAVALRAMLYSIAEIINRHLIVKLCAINGCPPDKTPYLEPGDVAAPPLTEIVAYVQGMAAAGMLTPDEGTERWVRQVGGMPEPDPEASPGQAVTSEGDTSDVDDGSGKRMPDESGQTEAEELQGSDT